MTDLKLALADAVEHLRIAMDILDDVSASQADQDAVILGEMVRTWHVLDAARGLLVFHPKIEEKYKVELAERDLAD